MVLKTIPAVKTLQQKMEDERAKAVCQADAQALQLLGHQHDALRVRTGLAEELQAKYKPKLKSRQVEQDGR